MLALIASAMLSISAAAGQAAATISAPVITAKSVESSGGPNAWQTLGTIGSTWIEDLSFVSGTVGFAAGGDGQVLKTVDGAQTWTAVLTSPYPYYWHGVQALNANDIAIVGEINGLHSIPVVRWSHDGGATWSDDVKVNHSAIGNRIHFWDSTTGFVTQFAGGDAFRTTTGGLASLAWTPVTIDPSQGWSGAQFSALPNGHVRISGIDYCESDDFAATFNCRLSIDPVSDYATYFVDDLHGWVGGGGGIGVPEGSPPLFEGWVHRTTDGGATWSGRTLDTGWPIRSIIFVNERDGWAMGGGGSFGGAYVTHDGGRNWQVELDAGLGLTACATADYHVFCAGYDNSGVSHLYSRDYDHIRVAPFD